MQIAMNEDILAMYYIAQLLPAKHLQKHAEHLAYVVLRRRTQFKNPCDTPRSIYTTAWSFSSRACDKVEHFGIGHGGVWIWVEGRHTTG